MKLVLAFFLGAFALTNSALASNQDVDCETPGACIKLESSLEFATLKVESVKEEWKSLCGRCEPDRVITLTVSGYYGTLMAGQPMFGTDYAGEGAIIYIMAPISDATAPSYVKAQFVIYAGKEKKKVSFYQGYMGDKQLVELGEF